jgi:DNA-binding CsgD family transcriptional regulator
MNMIVKPTALPTAAARADDELTRAGRKTGAAADLQRVREILEVLRNRHVCIGWNVDETAAAAALAWFEGRVNGRVRDEKMTNEGMKALWFLHRHGQSLDWVFAGDPSGMICDAAAHSDQAAPATINDQIFVAIDKHITATMEMMRTGSIYALRDEESKKAAADADAAADAFVEASCALTEICPTTLRGVLALLDHVDSFNRGEFALNEKWSSNHQDWPDNLFDQDIFDVKGNQLGHPDGLSFEFWLLRNVRDALTRLSGAESCAGIGEPPDTSSTVLTEDERQIMQLVCEGRSNEEIGRHLNPSEGIIKRHVHSIYRKLAIRNRMTLAAMAAQHRE